MLIENSAASFIMFVAWLVYACVKVREQLDEHANSVLCFLHLSSRVQAPVISFGNRSLSLLSHLAGLLFGNSYESQLEYIRLTLNSLVLLLQLVRHCFIGEMTTKLVLGVSVLRAGLCLSVLWRSCLLEMAERVRREGGSGWKEGVPCAECSRDGDKWFRAETSVEKTEDGEERTGVENTHTHTCRPRFPNVLLTKECSGPDPVTGIQQKLNKCTVVE